MSFIRRRATFNALPLNFHLFHSRYLLSPSRRVSHLHFRFSWHKWTDCQLSCFCIFFWVKANNNINNINNKLNVCIATNDGKCQRKIGNNNSNKKLKNWKNSYSNRQTTVSIDDPKYFWKSIIINHYLWLRIIFIALHEFRGQIFQFSFLDLLIFKNLN